MKNVTVMAANVKFVVLYVKRTRKIPCLIVAIVHVLPVQKKSPNVPNAEAKLQLKYSITPDKM